MRGGHYHSNTPLPHQRLQNGPQQTDSWLHKTQSLLKQRLPVHCPGAAERTQIFDQNQAAARKTWSRAAAPSWTHYGGPDGMSRTCGRGSESDSSKLVFIFLFSFGLCSCETSTRIKSGRFRSSKSAASRKNAANSCSAGCRVRVKPELGAVNMQTRPLNSKTSSCCQIFFFFFFYLQLHFCTF